MTIVPTRPPLRALPLPLTLSLGVGALVFQTAPLLLSALLSRHLYTPTTIERLSLSPTRLRISAITFSDRKRSQLLALQSIALQWYPIRLDVDGFQLNVAVHSPDFRDTSYRRHLDYLIPKFGSVEQQPPSASSQHRHQQQRQQQHLNSSAPTNASATTAFPFAYSATLSNISLRLVYRNLQQIPVLVLPFTSLTVTSDDVNSLHQLTTFIDGLVGRALSTTSASLIPRDLRSGARRMARQAAVNTIDNLMCAAADKVGTLRKSVKSAKDFLDDLPEAQGLTNKLGEANSVLKRVEELLGRSNRTQSSQPPQSSPPQWNPPNTKRRNRGGGASHHDWSQYNELDEDLP